MKIYRTKLAIFELMIIQKTRYLPNKISNFRIDDYSKDTLFYYLSCLFKSVTGATYQSWLFLIALISGVAFGRGIYKFSRCKWISCYLFVASAVFIYFFNGMRQCIPMAILFCKADWITEKKYVRFVLLTALLAQIHASAWCMLLLIPLSIMKPWSIAILGIIIASCIFGIFYDSFVDTVDTVLEDTQYAGIGTKIDLASGSTVSRLLVSAVPVVLTFLAKKQIRKENNSLLNLCVNSSIMCMATYIVSTFTSGILVGRMAAYFNVFNIILLPWLALNCFEKKSKKIMVTVMVVMYGIFFYYQMYIAWGGLIYVSEALNMNFR